MPPLTSLVLTFAWQALVLRHSLLGEADNTLPVLRHSPLGEAVNTLPGEELHPPLGVPSSPDSQGDSGDKVGKGAWPRGSCQ